MQIEPEGALAHMTPLSDALSELIDLSDPFEQVKGG